MAKWQGHCCRADELNFHCSWQLLVVGASFLFLVTFSWVPCEADDLNSDAAALLAFYDGLRSAQKVTWDVKQSPCNWQGVFCSPNKDRVWLLRIPASELYGQIRPGSLGHLSALRVLSLRSNYLFGPLPTDLANCTQLRSLFLQDNALMGPLPSFQPSRLLTRIDLSFNKFNGSIADSLNSLPNLRVLYLQNNAFSGQIPDLRLHDLRQFSVANNKLTGSIPTSLQKFSCTAFSDIKNVPLLSSLHRFDLEGCEHLTKQCWKMPLLLLWRACGLYLLHITISNRKSEGLTRLATATRSLSSLITLFQEQEGSLCGSSSTALCFALSFTKAMHAYAKQKQAGG
eukprot:c12730_g1_i1 orf=133-1158(-)